MGMSHRKGEGCTGKILEQTAPTSHQSCREGAAPCSAPESSMELLLPLPLPLILILILMQILILIPILILILILSRPAFAHRQRPQVAVQHHEWHSSAPQFYYF